jgi:hypothetical protein
MIEQSLYEHLISQASLTDFLGKYAGKPAVFNQEAPADNDDKWESGKQYGRIVFSVDIQGDPERAMGGTLAVDVVCKDGEQFPEEIEPVARKLIHGYFFSSGALTVAAQWKNSSYFTEPTNDVIGCTIAFELLAFPVITTSNPDIIERINEWTASRFGNVHVINYDKLPASAWKPTESESAVYWRKVQDAPAGWIPDTYQTIWRTATVRCHIFSETNAIASYVAREIVTRLYAERRILKSGETPIMVNRRNTEDLGADPLRTGQVSVEATYAIVTKRGSDEMLQHISYN